ncbi:MAG: RluA family pseudouridine synthase [Treponema sp.]|nr:RluA family pseudouridine synthase [Treponema sp.]
MKQQADFTIIYSDDDIIVVNKRSGLLVAADRYDDKAPRLDLAVEKEAGEIWAVHRIDKDTSGLVVYARNAEAHKKLSAQFEQREVHKTYHCLVNGRPVWKEFHADYPLQVDGDKRHRTIVAKGGKPSETDFRLIGVCGPFSWLEACPRTGRTHQIRAHLREMKLTIVADPLYSGNQRGVFLSDFKRKWNGIEEEERPLLARLALHAYSISFTHPATGKSVSFTAPYPRDLEAVRKQMAKVFKVDPLAFAPSADAAVQAAGKATVPPIAAVAAVTTPGTAGEGSR